MALCKRGETQEYRHQRFARVVLQIYGMWWFGLDFGRHRELLREGQLEHICNDYNCVCNDWLHDGAHSPL